MLLRLETPRAWVEAGALVAAVATSDRFGNVQLGAVRTDIEPLGAELGDPLRVRLPSGEQHPARYVRTFSDVEQGELILFEDSAQRLALGFNQGSAVVAARASETGDQLRISRQPRGLMSVQLLGHPRVHLRQTGSTNLLARELAARRRATRHAGHGRRADRRARPAGPRLDSAAWNVALLLLADPRARDHCCHWRPALPWPRSAASEARIKWPNDILIAGRKVSGILVEGRPQEHWAVLGIGVNVALARTSFHPSSRIGRARSASRPQTSKSTLERLRVALEHWLAAPAEAVLASSSGPGTRCAGTP